MTRLRSRRTPVVAPPYERLALSRKRYGDSGRGAFTDAYPQPGEVDQAVRALRAAERHRDMLLAADPEWWAASESDE